MKNEGCMVTYTTNICYNIHGYPKKKRTNDDKGGKPKVVNAASTSGQAFTPEQIKQIQEIMNQ